MFKQVLIAVVLLGIGSEARINKATEKGLGQISAGITDTQTQVKDIVASVNKITTQSDVKLSKQQIQGIIDQLIKYKTTLKQLLQLVNQWLALLEQLKPLLPPGMYESFKQQLENLKELILKWCKELEALIETWQCKLKKACLKEDIAAAQAKYSAFKEKFADLKKICNNQKGFNKKCLISFQNLKKELQQFLNVEIQSLFNQLESIKDCLTDQEYKDCFNQISQIKKNIQSLIVNIQECLKKILAQEINAIKLEMISIQKQLDALKLEAQNSKDKVQIQDIINAMKKLQTQAQRLKRRLRILKNCFNKVAKCLHPEDYANCLEAINSLSKQLNILCKTIKKCIAELEKKLKVICFELELKEKEEKYKELNEKIQTLIQGIKFDCKSLQNLLQELKKLANELKECKEKIKELYKKLEDLKDCPQYEAFKERLDKLNNLFNALCKSVEFYIQMIQFLIPFFCKVVGPIVPVPIVP